MLRDLGQVWRIAEFSHKPFPAGRATHGGIEGVMALRAAHGFAADDVAEVVVDAPPLIRRLVGRPPVIDPAASYARLCLSYVVAKVLQCGEITITQFSDTARSDPYTFGLAALVRVLADGNPDPNALAPQSVSVRLVDGTTLSWHGETMLAHPSRPLSREQHLEKFRRCLDYSAMPLAMTPPSCSKSRLTASNDWRTSERWPGWRQVVPADHPPSTAARRNAKAAPLPGERVRRCLAHSNESDGTLTRPDQGEDEWNT